MEMWVQSLGLEDTLEEEMATIPLCFLENPMDRGSQQAIVHVVTKSQTWLSIHAQCGLYGMV